MHCVYRKISDIIPDKICYKRYYVAAATLLSERTTHIALFSLFQTLGFILGPGVMAGLAFIGNKEVSDKGEIVFDMYTVTA